MNAIIERIIIFNAEGDKREVTFTSGLNVVTGDSKTGKSSLIEIVDYCLFSSRSTIPKGIIDDYAKLFVIVLKISNKYLIIARENWKSGSGNRAFVKIEFDHSVLNSLNLQYFSLLGFKNVKDVQEEVERHLGLSVIDTRVDEDEDRRKFGKVSLRSMVSFLFQHQNLIANKHSLFYRFDDFAKRKKTVGDFPILIGWESSEYFMLYRELEQKRKSLKIEEKLREKMKVKDEELISQLTNLFSIYFKFIGLELDTTLSLEQLKKIAEDLPAITLNSYSNSNLKLNIENLKKERFEFQEKLREKEILINDLSENKSLSNSYSQRLLKLNINFDEHDSNTEIHCPVCENKVIQISKTLAAVKASRSKLLSELSKVETYDVDSSGQIELLQKERDVLKRHIGKISSEIEYFEKQDDELQKNKSFKEQSLILKGATSSNAKQLIKQNSFITNSSDLNALKERIAFLQEKVDGFDIESKIKESESFLADRMTEICNSLDFEDELKPGKLKFSLTDFVLYYHFKEREKISLSEMGSGANWLACHLSLFLGLLHLNCKSSKSAIPSFLIIDQPSQVYFPRDYKQLDDGNNPVKIDENIRQVKNIFSTILREISKIKKECGFEPQVIVMDHADEAEFDPYVRKRWKKDGVKLI